jgi:hypothetical protein
MTLSPSEQAVHAAIEAFYQALEQKNIALLRTVVTPDWEYLPELSGAAPGPDQMIPIFKNLTTALPDSWGPGGHSSGGQRHSIRRTAWHCCKLQTHQVRDSLVPPDAWKFNCENMAP